MLKLMKSHIAFHHLNGYLQRGINLGKKDSVTVRLITTSNDLSKIQRFSTDQPNLDSVTNFQDKEAS